MDDLLYLGVGGTLFSLGMVYIGIISGTEIISKYFYPAIDSKEELESVVTEEAEKLGIDFSKIKLKYSNFTGIKKQEEQYHLEIDRSSKITRPIIKHELYHLLKDCDNHEPSFFYFFLIAEPRAKLYELFGLKL